jgi:hypothetical protein
MNDQETLPVFPKLPELEPHRLLSVEGSKTVWGIAGNTEIGRWAFKVLRDWALNDHEQFFNFMLEFKKTEELHSWFLNRFHNKGLRQRAYVTVTVEKEQGRDEAEHLLLLSLRCRAWHHFVGDLLFYSLAGNGKSSRLEPLPLSLLSEK